MPNEFALKKRFGQNLQRLRSAAGITQEELGERAALHKNVIGELERGSRMPGLSTVLKLAAGLGLPAADLIEGMEWSWTEISQPPTRFDSS